jgi:hypothetical protein
MRTRALLCLSALSFCHPALAEKRDYPCKIPEIAATCYTTRGRLLQAEGTPSVRLWKIGTHRTLGVYSSEQRYKDERGGKPQAEDSEAPELPANVNLGKFGDFISVYGDFEVCPLTASIPGHMQPVCIESATHLVYKKD